MSFKNSGRRIWIFGVCAALCLTSPMEALGAEVTVAKNVGVSVGASTLVSDDLSVEEYITIAEESQNSFWGYTNLGIANVESGNLNIREEPSTDASLVGKLPKNAACEVISIEDDWAYIQSGDVEGYVKVHSVDDSSVSYLLIGVEARLKAKEVVNTVARVTASGVNVRDEASMDGAVLTQVQEGALLEYIETVDDEWIKVSIDDEEAYIYADYVEVEETLDTAVSMSELLYGMGVSDLRVSIVEYAKQFLGNPYVYGGTSLTNGTDCSGFVMRVYEHFGISISRTSRAQAKDGTSISASELQPGDLVFYANSSGTINHVALYIGNGQVIHASNPKSGIKISNYNYRTPVKYVRIIQD